MSTKPATFGSRLSTFVKGSVILLGILAALSSLFGCNNPIIDSGVVGKDGKGPLAKPNTSGVVGFSYGQSGTSMESNYSCTFKKADDGTVLFTYENLGMRDYGDMTCEVDPSVLGEIEALYLECNLASWDGFSKSDTSVLDGGGFSVSVTFADGTTMRASGSNCYPDGYREFAEKVAPILSPNVSKAVKDAREKLVAKGLSGNVEYVMATFKQQGASGDDEYSFMITKLGERAKNFDVTIESEGEFFPAGKHRYYCDLPDEAIDFDAIQALIDKYNVVSWIGWDETAEDYRNCEWFQLDVGYDSEDNVSAMGTAHPENYDEFRAEFLTLMAEIVANAEQNYGLVEYSRS